MADVITSEYRLATETGLKEFVATILRKVGVTPGDAAIVADVLVAADLRGIESHGVARLETYYVSRIRAGQLDPTPKVTTARETATSILVDAGNGLGHPTGKRTMEAVLAKAEQTGAAFGAVRNSNHYGIAGYYAMLALDRNIIGIASTNSTRFGAPTFGRDLMLGTNPLAFAIPAKHEPAFVLDFATTTVPKGKLEVYNRKGKQLNPGWAIDANGNQTLDPQVALKGALLPLGGFGTASGGHKGFGLGLMCEILCGVLAGAAFGPELSISDATSGGGHVGHFFGALRIDAMRDLADFKADMDRELRAFRTSAPLPGHDRVQVAGDPERENERVNRRDGVPHLPKVWEVVDSLATDLKIKPMQRC